MAPAGREGDPSVPVDREVSAPVSAEGLAMAEEDEKGRGRAGSDTKLKYVLHLLRILIHITAYIYMK